MDARGLRERSEKEGNGRVEEDRDFDYESRRDNYSGSCTVVGLDRTQ